jgi:uncharacterized protein with PIN domain
VAYWDTSALVKLYVTEPDSSYFIQLIAKTDEPIISSAVAITEALCVFYRKEHALALKSGGARRIYQVPNRRGGRPDHDNPLLKRRRGRI